MKERSFRGGKTHGIPAIGRHVIVSDGTTVVEARWSPAEIPPIGTNVVITGRSWNLKATSTAAIGSGAMEWDEEDFDIVQLSILDVALTQRNT